VSEVTVTNEQNLPKDDEQHYNMVTTDGTPLVMPIEGQFLGKVKLQRTLGKGSMGVVFKAHEPELDLERAVKIPKLDSDRLDIARFKIEAKIGAKLNHPNLVKVHHVDYWMGVLPCSVMDYIQGKALPDLIKEKPLPPPVAISIAAIICNALEYAHGQTIEIDGELHKNLIHRDIKPGNILISDMGDVKLTDFGLVKFQSTKTISVRGMILGTLPYMAPELQGTGLATVSTDIYAIGVTLYEILTGKRPFPEDGIDSYDHSLKAKIDEEYIRANTLVPSIDKELNAIIDTCLSRNPQKRYSTYSVLKFHLDCALEKFTNMDPEAVVRLFIANPKTYKLAVAEKSRKVLIPKMIQLHMRLIITILLSVIITAGIAGLMVFYFSKKNDDAKIMTTTEIQNTVVDLPIKPDTIKNIVDMTINKQISNPTNNTKIPVNNKNVETPAQQISAKQTPTSLLVSAYKNKKYEQVLELYKSALEASVYKETTDSLSIIMLDAHFNLKKYRDGMMFGINNPVEDGKYYLLLAMIQENLGEFKGADESFNRAVSTPSSFDKTHKTTALIQKAQYSRRRYQKLQSIESKEIMLSVWKELYTNVCRDNQTSICQEARSVLNIEQ
jgi:serine/threonine-protein kinase